MIGHILPDMTLSKAEIAADNAAWKDLEQQRDAALNHLGDVLLFISNLHPDDRCRAHDEALAFYNSARPTQQVLAEEGIEQRLSVRMVTGVTFADRGIPSTSTG